MGSRGHFGSIVRTIVSLTFGGSLAIFQGITYRRDPVSLSEQTILARIETFKNQPLKAKSTGTIVTLG